LRVRGFDALEYLCAECRTAANAFFEIAVGSIAIVVAIEVVSDLFEIVHVDKKQNGVAAVTALARAGPLEAATE
jgi:hypothetical protein